MIVQRIRQNGLLYLLNHKQLKTKQTRVKTLSVYKIEIMMIGGVPYKRQDLSQRGGSNPCKRAFTTEQTKSIEATFDFPNPWECMLAT